MSSINLITLAITETQPNTDDFNVIAMEPRNQNIVALNLSREQIVTPSGEIFWDIGFLSTVNSYDLKRKFDNENSPYILDGSAQLGENKTSALKSVFEAKSNIPQVFFDNIKHRYGIVKVTKIHDIYTTEKNNSWQHRLSVYINGIPAYKNPIEFLNKDYRWVNFWNRVCENNKFNEKKKDYVSLFNRKEKDLYLVLYRHYYDKPVEWIVGIHWL